MKQHNFLTIKAKWNERIISTKLVFNELYQDIIFNDEAIVFRGQTCGEWALESTLFRLYKKVIGKNNNINIKNFLWMAEEHFLNIIDKLNNNSSKLVTLAEAQHLGTPTSLIDFTSSFENAIWFAMQSNLNSCDVCDFKNKTTCTPAIFLILKEIGIKTKIKNLSSNKNVIYKCPISINSKRGVSQKSFFILHNKTKMMESYNVIKISIANNSILKDYIKNFLFKLGVDHESIFPDLKGVFNSYIDEHFAYNIHILKGNKFNESYENDKSIKEYEQAIKLKPDLPYAYSYLGATLNAVGNYKNAIKKIKTAIKLNPQYAEAYNNFGTALKNAGRPDESIINYKKAIELNPSLLEAHYNLGNTLIELGYFKKAVQEYKKIIKIDSKYWEVYNNLGNALSYLGEHKEAINAYKKAINLNHNQPHYYVNLGHNLNDMNNKNIQNKKAILVTLNNIKNWLSTIKPTNKKAIFNKMSLLFFINITIENQL